MRERHQLHVWEYQPVRDLLWLGAIAAVLWLGYVASVVTVPLLLGLLLAYLVEPLLGRAIRLHPALTRGRVLGIVVALLIAATLAVLVVVVPAIVRQAEHAAAGRGAYAKTLERIAGNEQTPHLVRPVLHRAAEMLAEPPPAKPPEGEQWRIPRLDEARVRALVAEELARLRPEAAAQRPLELASQTMSTIGTVVGGGVTIGLGLFLTLYFLVSFSSSWPAVQERLVECIPPQRRERTLQLLEAMDGVVSGFVRGRLVIAATLAALYMVGWWLAGVPYALVLGLLTGIAILIPYLTALGLLAAYASVVIAALSDPGSVPRYVDGEGIRWLLVLILPAIPPALGQILDDYVLTPLIQGKATRLSSPTVLAVVIAGGAVGGIYGMLVAIPLAGCLRILFLEVFAGRLRAWWRTVPPIVPAASDPPGQR